MQYPSAAAVIWNQDLEMFLLPCLALEMVRCENQCDPLYLESLNLGVFFYSVQFTCVILYMHLSGLPQKYTRDCFCNYFLKPV